MFDLRKKNINLFINDALMVQHQIGFSFRSSIKEWLAMSSGQLRFLLKFFSESRIGFENGFYLIFLW